MKKIILTLAGLTLAGFALLGTSAFAGTDTNVQYDLRVDGLTCPFCAATSEKALKKIEGVTKVSTDLETATISVCTADTVKLTDEQLTKLFKKKGFTYVSKTKQDGCTVSAKKK